MNSTMEIACPQQIPVPSSSRSHVSEMFWTVLAQLGAPLASIITLKVLTVYLSPGDYGVISVVLSYVFAICAVAVAPMSGPGAIFYHQWAKDGKRYQFLYTLLALYVLVAAVLTTAHFGALSLRISRHNTLLGAVFLFGGMVLFVEVLKNSVVSLTNVAQFRRRYAVLSFLDGWGRLLLGLFFMVLAGRTFGPVLIAFALNGALVAFIGWYAFLHSAGSNHSIFPTTLVSKSLLSSIVKSGWAYCGIGLISWAISVSDRILLAAMVPIQQVGIYTASYQVATMLPMALYSTVGVFVFPIIYQRNAWCPAAAAGIIGKSFGYLIWLATPITILALLGNRLLLSMFLGRGYDGGAQVILWVAPAYAFNTLISISSMPFWLKNRSAKYLRIIAAAAAFNIVFNLIFIPKIGFMAGAISTFVAYLLLLVVSVIVGRRVMRWTVPPPHLWAAGLGSALGGIAYVVSGGGGSPGPLLLFLFVYFLSSTLVLLLFDGGSAVLAGDVVGFLTSWTKSASWSSNDDSAGTRLW